MMVRKLLMLGSALLWVMATGMAGTTWAADIPSPLIEAKAEGVGIILTDAKGMTLYTFKKDTQPDKSVCTGSCATNWPPFRPEASAPAPQAPLSLFTRDDGSKQYAYKGKPLYYYVKDKKAGEVMGNKVGGNWFVATP